MYIQNLFGVYIVMIRKNIGTEKRAFISFPKGTTMQEALLTGIKEAF